MELLKIQYQRNNTTLSRNLQGSVDFFQNNKRHQSSTITFVVIANEVSVLQKQTIRLLDGCRCAICILVTLKQTCNDTCIHPTLDHRLCEDFDFLFPIVSATNNIDNQIGEMYQQCHCGKWTHFVNYFDSHLCSFLCLYLLLLKTKSQQSINVKLSSVRNVSLLRPMLSLPYDGFWYKPLNQR